MINDSRRTASPLPKAIAAALGITLLSGCATLQEHRQDTLLGQADAAYEKGGFGRAALHYERYLQSAPGDAEAWFRLGNTHAEMDGLREAEAAYYRALELDPKLARARHNLGLVHMQLAWKNLLEARRALPDADPAAAETMRYLTCLMETFMGYPDPRLCRGTEP